MNDSLTTLRVDKDEEVIASILEVCKQERIQTAWVQGIGACRRRKIQKLLEAGRWSPTAVNGQPQRILVLNTPRELLHLPDTWQPVCMLYIGYPAEDFKPNPRLSGHRKPLSETCFYNEVLKEQL